MDWHYRKLYIEKYAKLDPFTTLHFFAEIEQPIRPSPDLMPYNEFLGTRLQEVVPAAIHRENSNGSAGKVGTSAVLFTVFRHQRDGVVDDKARRRMRLILPHMRRAVLIGKIIDLKTAEAASLADTLDGVSAGMFLVNARRSIVHADASGGAMLAERRSSCVQQAARLPANNEDAEQALHDVFLAAGSGDAGGRCKGHRGAADSAQ